MEDFTVAIALGIVLCIALAILQICFFFKIWVMTNDVREVKDLLKFTLSDLHDGDLVVNLDTQKQMRIKGTISAYGTYECYTCQGTNYEGSYPRSKLMPFDEYTDKLKSKK